MFAILMHVFVPKVGSKLCNQWMSIQCYSTKVYQSWKCSTNSDLKVKKRPSKLSADLGISIKGDFKVENGVQISDI